MDGRTETGKGSKETNLTKLKDRKLKKNIYIFNINVKSGVV